MSKYTINESSFLPEEVKVMGSINFEGNIIPMEWFSHLKLDNGKPDTISILILSDIVYWYRPTIIRDELSGRIIGSKKKFKSDLLQRSYGDFENLLGFSEKQTREALIRLEKRNILERVFRHINVGGQKIPNVMFIKINPYTISEITNKLDNTSLEGTISFPAGNHTLPSKESYGSSQVNTNTETTTKITTKNSLSLKKSSNSKTVEQNVFEREKEMINIWDRILREGEKPSVPSHARLVNLKNLLEESLENDLTNWESYCLTIKKSKFLMGGGANNWKADLTWAIKKENLIRVLESYYHQREEKTTEGKNEEVIEDAEETCNDPTWNNVKEILKRKKGEDTYKSWFKKLSLKGYENDKALLIAPSKFIKEWILTNYMHDIIDSFKQTDFKIKEIEIFIESGKGEVA